MMWHGPGMAMHGHAWPGHGVKLPKGAADKAVMADAWIMDDQGGQGINGYHWNSLDIMGCVLDVYGSV